MRQPGIEVRPIRMISGESEFNEVFYTDAVCPKDEVVGGVNNGWAVAMSLLGFERGEAAATMPIRFQAELDRLFVLAKERGVDRGSADPPAPGVVLRQGADHAVPRDAHADPVPGRPPPRPGRRDHQAVLERVPPPRHRAGRRHPRRRGARSDRPATVERVPDRRRRRTELVGVWVDTFLNARAGTIYAGSSQIQRNIIGEMVLGLPKEPKARRDAGPWRGGAAATRACGRWRVRQWRRLVPSGWWRRWPFLPVPAGRVPALPAG